MHLTPYMFKGLYIFKIIKVNVYLILCSSPCLKKKKPYNNINIWRYRHKGGDISASTRRQARGYAVVRRAGEAEKAEYDPRARSSIITSFIPRYAKLYRVYIQGWWAGKQKPYGSKMEKFDVVGRSSRCSQSTDKHLHKLKSKETSYLGTRTSFLGLY